MINGLIVFAALTAVLLYIVGVFTLTAWLAENLDRFDIAIPWLVAMTLLIVLPVSIGVAVSQ